jgi:hypothetical protein
MKKKKKVFVTLIITRCMRREVHGLRCHVSTPRRRNRVANLGVNCRADSTEIASNFSFSCVRIREKGISCSSIPQIRLAFNNILCSSPPNTHS